jgi:hypothetical protein
MFLLQLPQLALPSTVLGWPPKHHENLGPIVFELVRYFSGDQFDRGTRLAPKVYCDQQRTTLMLDHSLMLYFG